VPCVGGHVFISYRHGVDDRYVDDLVTALTAAGIPVWHDKQIISGDRWERVIKQKIDSCVAFVVVMTPEAEDSDWVMREVAQADRTNRPILPLLRRGEVFFRLVNVQFEDVRDGRMPGAGFIARLRQLTEKFAAPARFVQEPTPEAADAGRGRDVEAEVTLDFIDAAVGVTLPITLRSPGRCDVCLGEGQVKGRKCSECAGTGGVTKTRTLNVRVPSGVAPGHRIRLAGRGEPGQFGGRDGDLHLLIKVRPHPVFGRDGDDVTLTAVISFAEAVFGTDLQVPTLDGVVTLRLARGTPGGRVLRVRGRGIPRRDGGVGDMLITVEVDVPIALSDEAAAAVRQAGQLMPPADRTLLEEEIRKRLPNEAGG
jgi:DnaJ-class molecular chaperone